MPGNGKSSTVYVFVSKNADGNFVIDEVPELVFNKRDDKMHKNDFYLVNFTVINQNDSSYYFESADAGFWVQDALLGCPDKFVPHKNCRGLNTRDNGKILTVKNDDPDVEMLKYRLNLVSKKQGEPDIFLDPIMNNQNSGITANRSLSLRIATGAIAGIALIAGVAALTASWRDAADD